MEPNKKLTPLFFFLSAGTLITLIMSVSAFLALSFEILNRVLPDILTDSYQYGYANYSYESARSALALLIIIFPVFLILSRFWSKEIAKGLSHWDDALRKWVLYLIIFLASATTITTLVTLVRYFVSGEITTRFILKVLITLVVSAMPLWYYIKVLRGTIGRWSMWMVIKSTVLVLALVVWSFYTIGSPTSQRKLRLDQRRLDDLQSIQWQIISYWQQKEKLPTTLDDLNNPLASYAVPRDPAFESGRVYEYKKTGDKTFELCATFDLPIPKGWVPGQSGGAYPMRDIAVSSMPSMPGGIGESWDHDAGQACFSRTIDPDLYPPYPKPVKG